MEGNCDGLLYSLWRVSESFNFDNILLLNLLQSELGSSESRGGSLKLFSCFGLGSRNLNCLDSENSFLVRGGPLLLSSNFRLTLNIDDNRFDDYLLVSDDGVLNSQLL